MRYSYALRVLRQGTRDEPSPSADRYRVRRQRIALPDSLGEVAEEVGDAVRLIGHQRTATRQDQEAIAVPGQHLSHPQHEVRAIERLVDVAFGAEDARIEVEEE